MSDEARLTAIPLTKRSIEVDFGDGPVEMDYYSVADVQGLVASHAQAVKAQEQEKEFYDRCQELGATDTDIVKHALEDQARIRREMVPMSLHIQQLEADLTAVRAQLEQAEKNAATNYQYRLQAEAALTAKDQQLAEERLKFELLFAAKEQAETALAASRAPQVEKTV